MADYAAPLADMRFALDTVARLPELAALPDFAHADAELVDAVMEGAARFAGEIVAPLNIIGDKQGSRLENGVVRTPDGFKEAYQAYVDGGWNAVAFDTAIGGQGLPRALNACVVEMWTAANMAWALNPLLTVGAVEALEAHGTAELKRLYLVKLVSGEWTASMNLTEPQAGSDVGAMRTRATREGDRYRIKGQKIFITYGDHDLTPNIVHMVLARSPDGPPGTAGLSLFLIPKYLVNADGSLGAKNDVRPVSLEHKLGIHASPTCVMAYGDNDGAIGWLVGEENRGMECMFTMMNNARLQVGSPRPRHRRARLSACARLCADAGAGQAGHRDRAGRLSDRASSRRAADAAVDAGANRGDARDGVLRRRDDRPRPPFRRRRDARRGSRRAPTC